MNSEMATSKPVMETPKALFATSNPDTKPKRPLELDMGEGSRLQGFRLNGSR